MKMSKDFVNPIVKSKLSNSFCPLCEGHICKGRLCVFWENPNYKESKDIPKMCLVRNALRKFVDG